MPPISNPASGRNTATARISRSEKILPYAETIYHRSSPGCPENNPDTTKWATVPVSPPSTPLRPVGEQQAAVTPRRRTDKRPQAIFRPAAVDQSDSRFRRGHDVRETAGVLPRPGAFAPGIDHQRRTFRPHITPRIGIGRSEPQKFGSREFLRRRVEHSEVFHPRRNRHFGVRRSEGDRHAPFSSRSER